MTTLLVTGGCGFIGSNFIHYILDRYPEYKIINLDKLTYGGNLDNLRAIKNDSRYRFVKGDVCNTELVNELMKEVDGIVHFAAESHVDRSIDGAMDFIRSNVLGTQVLLEAALRHGNKRFHYISTDEVFGHLGEEGRFDENSPHKPRNPYAASKAAAEHLVKACFYTHQLPITISNSSNNYGPYQYPEKLIPLFVTNLVDGKKVPVYGTGKNVRDWIHVLDHCRAIDLIYHQGEIGESYCICTNCEKRNTEITRHILDEFKLGEEMIEYVPDRKGHDFRYAMDNSKIERLGLKPEIDFSEGMKKTIEWYRNNEWWWRKLKESR